MAATPLYRRLELNFHIQYAEVKAANSNGVKLLLPCEHPIPRNMPPVVANVATVCGRPSAPWRLEPALARCAETACPFALPLCERFRRQSRLQPSIGN